LYQRKNFLQRISSWRGVASFDVVTQIDHYDLWKLAAVSGDRGSDPPDTTHIRSRITATWFNMTSDITEGEDPLSGRLGHGRIRAETYRQGDFN
jgi:hypothetical protein